MQTHIKTEYKWTSPPRGTVSFLCYPPAPCGVIWCTEDAFLAWCFPLWELTHSPTPHPAQAINSDFWLICFSERRLPSLLMVPCISAEGKDNSCERLAFGVLIQTKHLRERSCLKAVNNATVMSLYKIEKSLHSGRGVFSHVTAPWSPTWCSC